MLYYGKLSILVIVGMAYKVEWVKDDLAIFGNVELKDKETPGIEYLLAGITLQRAYEFFRGQRIRIPSFEAVRKRALKGEVTYTMAYWEKVLKNSNLPLKRGNKLEIVGRLLVLQDSIALSHGWLAYKYVRMQKYYLDKSLEELREKALPPLVFLIEKFKKVGLEKIRKFEKTKTS